MLNHSPPLVARLGVDYGTPTVNQQEHDRRWGGFFRDAGVDEALRGLQQRRPDDVRPAEVWGDGREVGEGPGERVEEAHSMARLAAQQQEALGAGLKVVAGELREVDTCAGTGGEVEEATAIALGAVGQHDPAAGAEATVQTASLTRIIGAVPPLLARSTEADVLGHVVEEKPTGDIVKEHRRQVRPISPADTRIIIRNRKTGETRLEDGEF